MKSLLGFALNQATKTISRSVFLASDASSFITVHGNEQERNENEKAAIKILPGFIARVRVRCGKTNCRVTVLAYSLAAQEVKTDGDFTHFIWIAVHDGRFQDRVQFDD